MSEEKNSDKEQLPTQYELTKIAAILSNSTPDSHYGQRQSKVEQAFDLWERAGDLLKLKESPFNEIQRVDVDYVGQYREAMKVGKQFLPYIPDEFFKAREIKMPDFLRQVVGLSDSSERMKWFRAYVRSEQSNFVCVMSSEEDTAKFWDSFMSEEGDSRNVVLDDDDDFTNEVMECLRLEFFSLVKSTIAERVTIDKSPYLHAKGYREWRLKMKTEDTKSTKPYSVKDCINKGIINSEKKDK